MNYIQGWMKKFEEGETITEDKPDSERQSTANIDVNL